MPSRTNPLYQDPALAEAIGNLTGMFGPPKGADLAGYATAAAKKAEASRLATLFQEAQNPTFDKTRFDRMGQAAGQWNPSNGYYGTDLTAQTSLTNNAADNARALQQTQMKEAGDTTRTMLGPVAAGATRFVPPSIASMYQVAPTQTGVVEVKQGETATLPDGRVLSGRAPDLNESQFKAQQFARLQGSGQLTDQQIHDMAIGEKSPVVALGPDGKTAVYMSPGEAARTRSPVAAAPSSAAAKPSPFVARLADGTTVPANQLPDGTYADAQTGAKIEGKFSVFNVPTPQGSALDVGLVSPTGANNTAANSLEAHAAMTLQRIQDFKKLLVGNPGVLGATGTIRGYAQDVGSFIDEMSQVYGGKIPAMKSIDDVRKLADDVALKRGYDPAIRQARSMALEMAYNEAKMHDPSGEVNVREMEKFLDKYNGGLGGNQNVLASLDELERLTNTKLKTQVGTLRAPGKTQPSAGSPTVPAAAAAPAPAGPERWERVNGRLQRVQ